MPVPCSRPPLCGVLRLLAAASLIPTALAPATFAHPATTTAAPAAGSRQPQNLGLLLGQWESSDGQRVLIHLPNGKAASLDRNPSAPAAQEIRYEIGTYTVDGDTIHYDWILSGPEAIQFQVEDDTLSMQTPTLPSIKRRVAGAEGAQALYAAIEKRLRQVSEQIIAETPVGPIAQHGAIRASGIIADPNGGRIFPGATVYTKSARFQWIQTPVRMYKVKSPNEPGLTCCSFTFLPNGRYYFDGWRYDVLLDDTAPFDERNPADVRRRTVNVHHEQFWGRYRVRPGHGALASDTVDLVRDNGSRETVHILEGRVFLATENSHLLFNNWELNRKYRPQAYQF